MYMKKTIYIILLLTLSIRVFSQNFRDSIDVTKYRISLSILDFSNKNISGNTIVTLKPVFDNTKTIKLDLLELDIDKILVNDKKTKKWTYNDSIITINLKNAINKDEYINVQVFYSGTPQKDKSWGGFYFSSKDAYNMGVGMAAVPHSYGRVWYPCIDNFTDKATYEYYITVDDKYKVSCGGHQVPMKFKPEDQFTYHWIQENEIPTYLSSITIGNYDIIEDTYEGIERDIPIEIYTYKGKKSTTEKSFVNLKTVMGIYENLFGAYQWDKIGYSEVSFSGGAMEHAGNTTITHYAFDGTLQNETLFYHELSHSWFGNLVTCESAKDMWLNEGWASYCESIFLENLYGNKRFKDYNRNRHYDVIHSAHKIDKGYRSVGNMDINYTYGSTIYDKGAEVVHTLRNYLGDSLFYPAVRVYLKKYAFATANTEDLKNTLAEETNVNLDDFFDFWVYSKGFTFFEISNYSVKPNGENFDITVKVNQRLVETENFANSNKLELNFMDSSFNIVSKIIKFSGESGKQTYTLPFNPALVMLDINEKTADATIDKYSIINKKGEYIFDESLFDAKVLEISDSSFLRVTCNCIEPNNSKMPGYIFQKNYYWTIEGLWNDDFKAKGMFYISNLMDKTFLKSHNSKDFILMYRENMNQEWKEIEFNYNKKYLEADLKTGQYIFALKTYE